MMNKTRESIFVVDDDQGILDSFDVMLGDDYPLTLINNGPKAVELLMEQNPGLIFLDLKMPGMDGLALLQWMQERHLPTKVVIVTALPQDHYEERAHQYGVYRYLKKPLDVEEIESITKTALN